MPLGRVMQGGSTLTQQLAKNIFLSHERSFSRKIQEVVLAIWLERHFTKEQILSIYLNRVYLGGGTFGVDAASQLYFGKLVSHLNLPECAVIAGLLKAPNRYARNHDQLRKRTMVVLHNMLDTHYITPQQFQDAKNTVANMTFKNKKMPSYRYFTDWVAQELEGLVDTSQDLIVTTTLDAKLQDKAMQAIPAMIKEHGTRYNVNKAPLWACPLMAQCALWWGALTTLICSIIWPPRPAGRWDPPSRCWYISRPWNKNSHWIMR